MFNHFFFCILRVGRFLHSSVFLLHFWGWRVLEFLRISDRFGLDFWSILRISENYSVSSKKELEPAKIIFDYCTSNNRLSFNVKLLWFRLT